MGLSRTAWKRIGIGVAAVVVLAPGWEAHLVPIDHDVWIAAAAEVAGPFGVSVDADEPNLPGARWDAQYLDSAVAGALYRCGLRKSLPSIVPPDAAAHVPPPVGGVQRADAYYRVVSSARWPWWRPGGGIDWKRH